MTTDLFLGASLVTALFDAVLLLYVARIGLATFRLMKWPLAGAAAGVYAFLWGYIASWVYWEEVYRHVFPGTLRWWLPLVYGLAFGLAALLFWSLAVRTSRWPAVWFCLLGGLVSIPGHAWGMARGLMKVPLLAHASPASALLFGFFEFIVYFAAITGLARLVLAFRGAGRGEGAGR